MVYGITAAAIAALIAATLGCRLALQYLAAEKARHRLMEQLMSRDNDVLHQQVAAARHGGCVVGEAEQILADTVRADRRRGGPTDA